MQARSCGTRGRMTPGWPERDRQRPEVQLARVDRQHAVRVDLHGKPVHAPFRWAVEAPVAGWLDAEPIVARLVARTVEPEVLDAGIGTAAKVRADLREGANVEQALALRVDRPGRTRRRAGSTSTTKARAAWTYIGNPSRNGRAGAMRGDLVDRPDARPSRAGRRRRSRGSRSIPPRPRPATGRHPSPSDRRSSVRRLMPSTGAWRSARSRAPTSAVLARSA